METKERQLKAFYFPHDIGASNDPKLIDLRMEFGWAGIGMYWAIIEALHKEDGGSLPIGLIFSMIKDFYSQEEIRTSSHQIEAAKEFEKALYANALLVVCDGIATSQRVQKNLQERIEKSNKARQSADKRWGNKPIKTVENANALRPLCERNAIKERKVNKSKILSTIVDKAKAAPKENLEITEVINYLKEKIGVSLDGSQLKNRRYVYLLLNKFKKDYPEKNPKDQIKKLIDFGLMDKFHGANITSFRYLFEHHVQIINTIKERAKKVTITSIG